MILPESISASAGSLAVRADVRAALPHHQSLDWGAAVRAGAARAPINAEMILKVAAAVHPVDGRAIAPDAIAKHLPDGGEQPG